MQSSESSNSPSRPTADSTGARIVTWLCRIILGAAFITAGWAKSIDPYGTLYKMLEYLNAWGLHNVPVEPVVIGAVALGAAEFAIGVCVLVGVLRHSAVVCASAVMAVMLPLTVYIAMFDPVADCGCFGDLLVISNTATLLKNIVLAACCVWLLARGTNCPGLYRRGVRWAVVVSSLVYALVLAAAGYNVQPLVDFRDYPLGTDMSADGGAIAAFDEDDEEVEVFDGTGRSLIFAVPDPGEHFLTRSRYANELARYAAAHGISTAAIVGTGARGLREWKLLAAPDFDVYSADDTDIKALVRGDIAAVYLRDGRIVWKRNLASLDADLVEKAAGSSDALDRIAPSDDGRLILKLTAGYLGLLLVLALPGLLPRRKGKRTAA